MVFYMGQDGRTEYHPASEIGRDDGMSEVTISKVEFCECGHPAEYHDKDGFCCGDYDKFKAVGPKGQSNCPCHEFRPKGAGKEEPKYTRCEHCGQWTVVRTGLQPAPATASKKKEA